MNLIKALILSAALSFSAMSVAAEVNINTADADELAEMLQGIGSEKAKAIVEFREKNGAFTSVEDLTKVPGIGSKTIEKNREMMRVSKK